MFVPVSQFVNLGGWVLKGNRDFEDSKIIFIESNFLKKLFEI